MILLEVIAHNFLQFKGTHKIVYPHNAVISLIGPNGSGKTSFFDMPTYPGYGKVAGKTKEEIPNETMEKGERCFVQIKFEHKGELYVARRDTQRSKDTFLAKANGEMVAQGVTATTKEFTRLFGVDFKTYCNAFIAQQDELRVLLTGETAERKKLITDLMSLNVSDIAAKKAKDYADALEKSIADLKNRLVDTEVWNAKKGDLEKGFNELLQQMSQTERLLEQERTLLKEKQTLLEQEEGRYRTYQSLLRSVDASRNKVQMLENQRKQTEERLQHLLSLAPRIEELAGCKEKRDSLLQRQQILTLQESQYKEKQRWEVQYDTRAKHFEKQLTLYNTEAEAFKKLEIPTARIQEFEQQLQELHASAQETHGAQQKLEGEGKAVALFIEQKTRTLEDLKARGADSPCPTCEQPLGREKYAAKLAEHEQEMQGYVEDREKLRERYREYDATLKGLKAKVQEVQQTLSSLREQERSYTQKQGEVTRLHERALEARKHAVEAQEQCGRYKDVEGFNEEEMTQLRKEIATANTQYDEWTKLSAMVEEIPNLQTSLSQFAEQMAAAETQYNTDQESLTQLGFQEEFYTTLVNEVRSLLTRTTELTNTSLRWQNEGRRIQQDIESAQAILDQHYATVNEISSVQNDIVMYRVMSNSFKGSKDSLLKKLEPALSQSMSRSIRDITNGRYDLIKLDETYSPQMYRNGILKPWTKFSGGEKDLLALLLRLSISDAIVAKSGSSFKSLFLDEVFSALDDDRKTNTMNLLRKLRSKFSQIYIVTHTESIKDMTDCTLRVSFDGKTSRMEWLPVPPHIEKEFEKTRELLATFAL